MGVLQRRRFVSQMGALYIACDLIGSMIIVSDQHDSTPTAPVPVQSCPPSFRPRRSPVR
ncbi:hypothetical protein BDI4_560123 [Burkholderia diffusa]|nr:hypothetical protein BDI4_560123 [Burkholderia diffusa]